IISASGMAEAGRILHHLKNNVEDERNTVLFVGFQAENTLGRKILTGETPVKIFGEPYEVNAEVARIESFSAHADRDELLGFVRGLKQAPEKIFVVHGEEESALAFARSLGEISKAEIHVPEMGEGYELK
nr:MBL fold metallo-hydrolase RNA specificity domain-containing protein [Candidatus Mcinerneyibacteriales bacterium]